MPAPFLSLTVAQFQAAFNAFNFRRRIMAVHMHHTFRPNHAQWRGLASIESMHRFHTVERGFSDTAQHLTIAPDGSLWTGRDWNQSPASASGHNGNSQAGPFMFEMIGDFDVGQDPLEGVQLHAVLEVISIVNRRFNLANETLMFHNQAAPKSCPGSAIDRVEFLTTLAAHQQTVAPAAPADGEAVQRALQHLSSMPVSRGASARDDGELECRHEHASSSTGRAIGGARGGSDLRPEDIDALRPHVINLRMGGFSDSGLMTSEPADVDRIFHEHLPAFAQAAQRRGEPLRIAVFAHGGLVKESTGLEVARKQVRWWLDNQVYPIHFVWETGLFETFGSLLNRAGQPPGARGFSDLSDAVLEEMVRALQSERIWGSMKTSAQLASAETGGARHFIRALKKFSDAETAAGRQLEVHAIGHSAGSIFHAHLLDAALAEGLPPLKTLQLLAPAVRVDTFNALIAPRVGAGLGVEALTLFTMRRDFELDDNCGKVYRKSLLYLVSESCEARRKTPILGLEVSLRADATTRALFGLGQPGSGNAEVVWSKSDGENGRSASTATTHGGFDDDAPTMNSVLRRVLGRNDTDAIQPFPVTASRALATEWIDEVDWPIDVLRPALPLAPATPPAPVPAAPPSPPATGTGRRKALCVGVDSYVGQPLAGCVADSNEWQAVLTGLGFDTTLLQEAAATRAGLVDGLTNLIAGAGPGDELVFQFAGHGTQFPDDDGDEGGGDTPGEDEAICPFDCDEGKYLIDDDIGAIIDRLAPGANLTMFIDCCHSGTISRFAIGGARPGAPSVNRRARFMAPTPERLAQHRAFRVSQPKTAATASRGLVRGLKQEVVFTACRSDQVAWESNGHGEFTVHATTLLRARAGSLTGLTHAAFHDQVVAAFGPAARQTPQLDCDDARRALGLLGARL